MQFMSGSKLHRFKFTLPNVPMGQNRTGPFLIMNDYQRAEPIRARFEWGNGHLFDSEKAQKKHGWSDKDREYVEKWLSDPDNGFYKVVDGRGIWPVDQAEPTLEPVEEKVEEPSGPDEWTQCSARVEKDGGWVACTNEAIPGGIHCDEHLQVNNFA